MDVFAAQDKAMLHTAAVELGTVEVAELLLWHKLGYDLLCRAWTDGLCAVHKEECSVACAVYEYT
jgi:hypothetical protein